MGKEKYIFLEKETQTLPHPVIPRVCEVPGVFCQTCFIEEQIEKPNDSVRSLFPVLNLITHSLCSLPSFLPSSPLSYLIYNCHLSLAAQGETALFLGLHIPLSFLHLLIHSSLTPENSKFLTCPLPKVPTCMLIIHPHVFVHPSSVGMVGKWYLQFRITSS